MSPELDPPAEPGLTRRPSGGILPESFFARSADEVAGELIGKILWRDGIGGGRLVEVEAYLPEDDPACHAARGMTPSNKGLFGPPGRLYVYINYGIHRLVNVTTGRAGAGTGVLLRGIEPLGDDRLLRRNRGDDEGEMPKQLVASGPGRLGQALGIDTTFNGRPLGPRSGVQILDDGVRPAVERTPRIGVGGGRELLLRYILPDSRFLSRPPRRGRPV